MKEKLGLLKNKWLFVILVAIIAIIAGVLVYANSKMSISFSDEMPETAPVNQVLDITQYINNPNDEILVLSAEYVQDGVSGQYAVAGLSFKPKYTGEVKLTVTISGTKKYIETTIEIVEAVPVFVSSEEANYYVGQTIQLEELMDYIVYDSKSTPELIVNKVEYGANKIDMTGVKEFTFEEITSYIFYVDIQNSGGSASGMVTARVTKELTPNEENDLTNTIRLISDTHASIEISEDEHSENSDWAWEITANAADVYEEANRNFFLNVVYIDFKKEIDTAKEYFTMDVKVSEDANGFRFNLMDSAGDLHEIAKDYNDVKGEWFTVSSEDLYDVGYYTGIFITIMHPRGEDKVGTYDVTNVKALVDNCFLHDRGDVKPITNKVVTSGSSAGVANLTSPIAGNIQYASHLHMQGDYTEECFEFTTTIQDKWNPNLVIGARLDTVTKNVQESTGIILKFNANEQANHQYVAIYSPTYHGANHVQSAAGYKFESGKQYTFIVKVTNVGNGNSTISLRIMTADNETILMFTSDEISGVPTKGSFAVWNLDKERSVSYKMPYAEKQNVNKIVASNGSDGTVTIESAYPGTFTTSGMDASFLQMKGNYGEECFEFTTKITQQKENVPNLLIGARLNQVSSNMYESKGIVIAIFNNRLAYYAPSYQGTNHKGSFGFSGFKLENGKEYTFIVQVSTETDGTEILNLTIKEGDKVLGIYSHTSNLASKGKMNVADSGSFAVWSLDATREIAYKMPYKEKQNVNKIVTRTEGDGTATLTTVNPGTMTSSGTNASYLEMKGNYTEEKFAFTTKITEAASSDIPNLLIGARLDQVTANMFESKGIVIAIFNNRLAYYAPSYQGANHKGSFGFSGFTLENEKEYTFVVQVETQDDDTDILNITIKDGKTVLGTYSHTTNLAAKGAIDVAASGSFAVWNLDATREIAYKQPRAAYTSYSVQGIVDGEDTTYSDAKTELRFTLDATPDVAENVEFTKTEESQVLYNGVEVSDYYFSRVGDDFVLGMQSLYNTDASAKDAPDTGDIIAVSGVFETLKNGVKGFELLSYEFTYVGDSWTWRTHEVSTITNGNFNITGGLQNEFLFKFSVNPNTPRDLNLASDGNHQVIYNGTELEKTEYGFYKVNEDGRYVLGVANALTAPIKGDTLMIKGVFEAVKDNVTYGLVVKEQTFYFDDTGWTMEYVEADPVIPDDGEEEESDNVLITITEVRVAGNTDEMGFEAKSASEYYLWLNVDAATLNSDLGYSSGAYSDYFKIILNGSELDCRIRVFNNNIALVLPTSKFSSLVNVEGTNITIPKGTTVTSTAADTKVLEFAETFTYYNKNGTTWEVVQSIPIKITGVRELNVGSKYLRFNLNITSLPADVNVFFLKAPIYINGVKQELVVRTIKNSSIFQVVLDASNLPTLASGLTISVPQGTVFAPSSSDGYKTGYPQAYILEEGFIATYNGSQWVNGVSGASYLSMNATLMRLLARR